MDRLTRFYWRVTRAESSSERTIAFYSPIACVESCTADCTDKEKKCISEQILTKYVCFFRPRWTNDRILGAVSSVREQQGRRTRPQPKSTGVSIFVLREAGLTSSRRAQSSLQLVASDMPTSDRDRDKIATITGETLLRNVRWC